MIADKNSLCGIINSSTYARPSATRFREAFLYATLHLKLVCLCDQLGSELQFTFFLQTLLAY